MDRAGQLSCTNSRFLSTFSITAIGFAMIVGDGCRKDPRARVNGASVKGPWFVESSTQAGIKFKHVSGSQRRYWFPEIMGGGACLFDFDGDGFLDLYLVQSGDLDPETKHKPANQLYRNRGDGSFVNVTDAAGVGDIGYGMGCTCGDYDNDGDVDLYVTNVGSNVLYRNEGDGTFVDVSRIAGVADKRWAVSAAFVDVDGDERLDLFVVNYIQWSIGGDIECSLGRSKRDYCSPKSYAAPATDILYRNNGDDTFVDVTLESGIHHAFGNGLGVACGDFGGDDHVDIYVANDGNPNQLWINDGRGRFKDEALIRGAAVNMQGESEAGMGVVAVDVENDGDLDLFLSHLNLESNTFYVNRGDWMEDVTATIGLVGPSLEATGFGVGFADFDLDGNLDLYVANGRVTLFDPVLSRSDPFAEPNQLFTMSGGGEMRFVEVAPRGGTAKEILKTSRAAAFGDLDNDGDVDIVVVNKDHKIDLLRNEAPRKGDWAMFRVLTRFGRNALNARVRIESGRRVQHRVVQRAYSYCASNDPRVHASLPKGADVSSVVVHWPGGKSETFGPFAGNAIQTLTEGTGR